MSAVNCFCRSDFIAFVSSLDLSALQVKERMQVIRRKALAMLGQLNNEEAGSVASFFSQGIYGDSSIQVLAIDTPCSLLIDGLLLRTQFAALSALNFWKNRDDKQVEPWLRRLAQTSDSEEIQRIFGSIDGEKKDPSSDKFYFHLVKGLIVAKLYMYQCPAVLHALLSTESARIDCLVDFSKFTDTKAVAIWSRDIHNPNPKVGNLQGLIWMLMREAAKEKVHTGKIEDITRPLFHSVHRVAAKEEQLSKSLRSLALEEKPRAPLQSLEVFTKDGFNLFFCPEKKNESLFWESVWRCDADYIIELCPKKNEGGYCPSPLQGEPLQVYGFAIHQYEPAEHYCNSTWQQGTKSCGFFVQHLEIKHEGQIKRLRYYTYIGGDDTALPELSSFLFMLGHMQRNYDLGLHSPVIASRAHEGFSLITFTMLDQLRRLGQGFDANVFEELAALERQCAWHRDPLGEEHYLFCHNALQHCLAPACLEEENDGGDISFSSDSSGQTENIDEMRL